MNETTKKALVFLLSQFTETVTSEHIVHTLVTLKVFDSYSEAILFVDGEHRLPSLYSPEKAAEIIERIIDGFVE